MTSETLISPSENLYEENVENLQKLLKFNRIVTRPIKELKCMAGSSSGDNYMSIVKRVQIIQQYFDEPNESAYVHDKLQHQQQQQTTDEQQLHMTLLEHTLPQQIPITVIIKRQIASLSRRQLYRCDEAFCNEINAYNHMVPLLRKYSPSNSSLFPQCYFAGIDGDGEIIILEDLKPLGFRMQNRLNGLDFNYCQLVMRKLAHLHAASLAAKHLNRREFQEKRQKLNEIVYCSEAEDFYRNILETSIAEALSSLRASNTDGSLSKPIQRIEQLQTQLFDKIQSFIVQSQEAMNVMCHGDLWVNNIMFQDSCCEYDVLNINAVRFFDLQAMRYTSPVFDILHFIFTSTKRDFRRAHLAAFLEIYCLELDELLQQHFQQGNEQLQQVRRNFSLPNITKEFYARILYGLAISMWILPAVTFDPNNIPNLDIISEMNSDAKQLKCTQKLTAEYHERIKDLALEFYHNGYFDAAA